MNTLRNGPTAFSRLIADAGRGLPALLTLAVIGVLGWWGHRHEWRLPKFSTLTGETRPLDDWCVAHGVPESVCVECRTELMPRPPEQGWCAVHGVPECPLCHPELAQLSKPPSVIDLGRAKRSLDFAERPMNNPVCVTHQRRLQFIDAATADKAGIAVEPVRTAPAAEFVSAPGEVVFDETRLARLSSRASGTVWRVLKHQGDIVKTGDVLALVEAADVGKAKAELLQAVALLELRTQALAALRTSAGAIAEVRMREADAAVREARIRADAARQALVNLGLPLEERDTQTMSPDDLRAKLHFLGLPGDVAKSLDPRSTTTSLLPLVAPTDGRIMSRPIIAGEATDTTRILFELADTARWWLTLDVRPEDARRLRIGQPVRFQPDAGKEEVSGRLGWISSLADPKTRTIKARAELSDPEGRQRANTFGTGRVIMREEPAVVSVPPEAVQWDGCCHVVFVRDKDYLKPGSPKVFHVRKVRIGAKTDATTEIAAGLLPGEVIVTKGSGLLLTQLLRDALGEGCACCHVR